MVSFSTILSTLSTLRREQLERLRDACDALLASYDELAQDEAVVEQRQRDGITYQLEYIKCGKPGCRCAGAGRLGHGPYWRAYWREGKKVKSKYIGKEFRLL